ncbi:DUF4304 domain-containing protein [Streptococcus suis]|uniref:DUF4304 domain-containing protein n=1 Tax=Streptococcus suis TaxID=1307 RepID=UPI00192D52D3|nr:DUF4304 domain-containing protein [Streptococcus suis]MBL6439574.1 DUF4304 domain-containing protein [Streptococcus suis]MBL6503468.1 DUF4304 domain-containing protein [Streptococcus suis]
MESKEFKKIVSEVLLQNGFTIRHRKYCLEDDSLIVFINFQKSNFSNSYYINYYFMIKSLHSKIQKLVIKDKDFGGRIHHYTLSGKTSGDFNLDEVYHEDIKYSIQKGIDKKIKPAFNEGIVNYLNSRPIVKMMSSKATKKYLEEQTKIS